MVYCDIWDCRFCEIGNDTGRCAKCRRPKAVAMKHSRWNEEPVPIR